jgi:hypothetical protein
MEGTVIDIFGKSNRARNLSTTGKNATKTIHL